MRTLQQLLDALGATSVDEVEIDLVFGDAVNSTGRSPLPGGPDFEARCGGIRLGISRDEAALLARHGAETDIQALRDLRQQAPLP